MTVHYSVLIQGNQNKHFESISARKKNFAQIPHNKARKTPKIRKDATEQEQYEIKQIEKKIQR